MIKIREYEFKTVKKTTVTEPEGEKFVIILKATNRLTTCTLELRVKTEDVFGAESELDFGLDMGDTIKFEKGKMGKQLKIAPSKEDLKKTKPARIQLVKPDMIITHEDREKVKRDREFRKKGRPKKVKD